MEQFRWRIRCLVLLAGLWPAFAVPAADAAAEVAETAAQPAAEVQVEAVELLDAAALEELVAPVALYPDDSAGHRAGVIHLSPASGAGIPLSQGAAGQRQG